MNGMIWKTIITNINNTMSIETKTPQGQRLLLLPVEADATNFFVNQVGSVRYYHDRGRWSGIIEPATLGVYATEENCKILGTYHVQDDILSLDITSQIDMHTADINEFDQWLLSTGLAELNTQLKAVEQKAERYVALLIMN